MNPSSLFKVTVADKSPNQADAEQTQALLEATWTGEFYKCPQCSYQTLDKSFMINHLAEEINTALAALAAMAKPAPGSREGKI